MQIVRAETEPPEMLPTATASEAAVEPEARASEMALRARRAQVEQVETTALQTLLSALESRAQPAQSLQQVLLERADAAVASAVWPFPEPSTET